MVAAFYFQNTATICLKALTLTYYIGDLLLCRIERDKMMKGKRWQITGRGSPRQLPKAEQGDGWIINGEKLSWTGEKLAPKWISGLACHRPSFGESLPPPPRKGWLNVAPLAPPYLPIVHIYMLSSSSFTGKYLIDLLKGIALMINYHPFYQLSSALYSTLYHWCFGEINAGFPSAFRKDQIIWREQTRGNPLREHAKCSKLHLCNFLNGISSGNFPPLCNLGFP